MQGAGGAARGINALFGSEQVLWVFAGLRRGPAG